MSNKLITKVIFDSITLVIPGISMILLFGLFSSIGVFIEEEKYLYLIGGYKNPMITIAFYGLSVAFSWIISISLFKVGRFLTSRFRKIFFIIFSLLFIFFSQILVYIILFRYLTGINIFDINIIISNSLRELLTRTIFMVIATNILVSGGSYIYLLLAYKNKSVDNSNPTNIQNNNTSSGSETSSFEDAISI